MFVVDLKIAIAGAWSLLLVGFASRVGAVVDEEKSFLWLGLGGALVAFAVNVAFAVPVDPRMRYLVALQLSTMVFAGLIGVMLYRMVAAIHDRRTGVFVGATTVLATPVGFWASLPKRHVLIALLALILMFAFHLSRTVESHGTAVWLRGVAYTTVGLAAWVNAPEALLFLLVLLPLDITTARSNQMSQLVMIGTIFLVSLIPFFITNMLISGNPMYPPRYFSWLLRAQEIAPQAGGGPPTPTPKASPETLTPTVGTPMESTPAGGGGTTPVPDTEVGPETTTSYGTIEPGEADTVPSQVTPITSLINYIESIASRGTKAITVLVTATIGSLGKFSYQFVLSFEALRKDSVRMYYIFIQSAHAKTSASATDLAIIETTPILAILAYAPFELASRIPTWLDGRGFRFLDSPNAPTDILGLSIAIGFTLLYLSRLPDFAMWTVRYLFPIFPIGMYFVGRLNSVRRIVHGEKRLITYVYMMLVFLGGQVFIVYLVWVNPTRGEVIQLHSLLGILAGAFIVLWAGWETANVSDDHRVGALAMALALAVGTLYVILTGLVYFVVGHFGLAMSEMLSESIPLL